MNEIKTTLILDRDGVINRRLPGRYVQVFDQFEFLPSAIEALKKLRAHFDYLFIVTNQQGIGKGLMTIEELENVHQEMSDILRSEGVRIDGIYYCPDLASKEGNCRKPGLKMAARIEADFGNIDFTYGVIIGDSASDLLFGRKLGMATVWIRSEPGRKQKMDEKWHDFTYNSLWEAAANIEEIKAEMLA